MINNIKRHFSKYIISLCGTLTVGLIIILFLVASRIKTSEVNKPLAISGYNSESNMTDNSEASGHNDTFSSEDKSLEVFNGNNVLRIGQETKMIYEYVYLADGKTSRTIEFPPYFLLNKTRESLEEMYADWLIVSFNSDEVIMRKEVVGDSGQSYIIGIMDGYLAIFYTDEINGNNLMDITDIPVSAFPENEIKKLEEGIFVIGDDELTRVLQDYSS